VLSHIPYTRDTLQVSVSIQRERQASHCQSQDDTCCGSPGDVHVQSVPAHTLQHTMMVCTEMERGCYVAIQCFNASQHSAACCFFRERSEQRSSRVCVYVRAPHLPQHVCLVRAVPRAPARVRRGPARARAQVMSGQLVAPNVPTAAETLEMQRLVDTYGKTFHTWQVDRGDQLPLGARAPRQAAPRPRPGAPAAGRRSAAGRPRRRAAARRARARRGGALPAAARQRCKRAPCIRESQNVFVAHEGIVYGVETGLVLVHV